MAQLAQSHFMEIIIDVADPTPPSTQLIEQVKTAVASGELLAGEQLPSIRQLAGDLDLNSKTVAKAYRLLERDNIIESRGYRGTFVHAEGKANCSIDLSAWVTQQLAETIAKFRGSGITDPEIRTAFSSAMNNKSA